MAQVLIVTNERDPTATFLEHALNEHGILWTRATVDRACHPTVNWELEQGCMESALFVGEKMVAARSVGAIIFRRPSLPIFGQSEPAERFLQREAIAGLRNFLDSCPATWINHPLANSQAQAKPENLRRASRLGLRTPATLVSSAPIAIRRWLAKGSDFVIKPVTHGLMEAEGEASMIFAQPLPLDFDPESSMTPGVPVILQERIRKKLDVRVTVIGRTVLAAVTAIPREHLDWRSSPECEWVPVAVPPEVATPILSMMDELSLNFAGLDFVVDFDGRWFFLELNPNGQWAWLETEAALPITSAFVNFLRVHLEGR